MSQVLDSPVVPERKRYCSRCDAKVSREKGFCPNCGTEYNFVPTLWAGDILGDQYQIKGPIAFGGLGWIYLGWDMVLHRWVVLKGLLNSKDHSAGAAAIAERQFLAAVKNPKIVNIYTFLSRGLEGFIVMEHIGGKTLKAIRQERGPLPVAEAIAYILGILPAFAYLHRHGYVYCDFKPDNFMLEVDDVKLIDLGGVRRHDDLAGDIYATKGYSAPESGTEPSFSSDLYTVGRTLAVLLFDFAFQGKHVHSLPSPAEEPLLGEHDSLRRWLERATAYLPEDRFQSAEEMGEQLRGVLRDVVAKIGTVRHLESSYFMPEALGDPGIVHDPRRYNLPGLKMDPNDPATSVLAGLVGQSSQALVNSLPVHEQRLGHSAEFQFFACQANVAERHFGEAERCLNEASKIDPYDWRILWNRGLMAMAEERHEQAIGLFDLVMDRLPGEIAPRLAKAHCMEIAGQYSDASQIYSLVTMIDPEAVSAYFGHSRTLAAARLRREAVEPLRAVPSQSVMSRVAKLASVRTLVDRSLGTPSTSDLMLAGQILQTLDLQGFELHRLAADLFLAAWKALSSHGRPAASSDIYGVPYDEKSVRTQAEHHLREAARYSRSVQERYDLIDEANSIRRWTLF